MTPEQFDKFIATPNGKEYAIIALETVAQVNATFLKHLTSVTRTAIMQVAEDMGFQTEGKQLQQSLILVCVINTLQNLNEMEANETQNLIEQLQTGVKA